MGGTGQWGAVGIGGPGGHPDGMVLWGRERLPGKAKGGGCLHTQGSAMEGPLRVEEATAPPKRNVDRYRRGGRS